MKDIWGWIGRLDGNLSKGAIAGDEDHLFEVADGSMGQQSALLDAVDMVEELRAHLVEALA